MIILRQLAVGLPYTNLFSSNENPVSDGGKIRGGLTHGLDWLNMQSGSGNCYATGFNPSAFDDSIACADPTVFTFTNNQFVEGVIFRAPGYNPTDNHEIELHLSDVITDHSIIGMEQLINTGGGGQMVPWNGALGDVDLGFGYITDAGFDPPVDGDVIRFERIGNVFSAYQNSVLAFHGTDASRPTGSPGWAAFVRPGDTVLANFGWKSITFGNL